MNRTKAQTKQSKKATTKKATKKKNKKKTNKKQKKKLIKIKQNQIKEKASRGRWNLSFSIGKLDRAKLSIPMDRNIQ